MGYIKGSTKLLLCQILQGKVSDDNREDYNRLTLFQVYHCKAMILGSDLIDVNNTNHISSCSTIFSSGF